MIMRSKGNEIVVFCRGGNPFFLEEALGDNVVMILWIEDRYVHQAS
jgi:GTP-dependent phosphoenolpyruvate carboxykinase